MYEGGAAARITDAGIQAISALATARIAPEALAALVPARRGFLRRVPPTMHPICEVWRLGVLLLAAPGSEIPAGGSTRGRGRRGVGLGLGASSGFGRGTRAAAPAAPLPLWFIAGPSTRSAERGRPNYQSSSREERREIAAAALRGGYPVGAVVHFDATPLPLDDGSLAALGDDSPVGLHAGQPRVRWRVGADLAASPEFERYVAERVALLSPPPLGAGF